MMLSVTSKTSLVTYSVYFHFERKKYKIMIDSMTRANVYRIGE